MTTPTQDVFAAKADTLAARIQALAPKLAYASGNSLHGRADCAKDAADGLQQLGNLLTDFYAAVACDRADETGVTFSSRYFRDVMSDAFANVTGEFANKADEWTHSDEEVG